MKRNKYTKPLAGLWKSLGKLNAEHIFPVVSEEDLPDDAKIIKQNKNGEWVMETAVEEDDIPF